MWGRGLTPNLLIENLRGVVSRKTCVLLSSPAEQTEIHSSSQVGFLNVTTTAMWGWIFFVWGRPVPGGILSTISGLYLACQPYILFLSWCDEGLQTSPSGPQGSRAPDGGPRARQMELVTMPSSEDTIPVHALSGHSSKGLVPAILSTPSFLTSSGPEPLFVE